MRAPSPVPPGHKLRKSEQRYCSRPHSSRQILMLRFKRHQTLTLSTGTTVIRLIPAIIQLLPPVQQMIYSFDYIQQERVNDYDWNTDIQGRVSHLQCTSHSP
ncbi:hypothetical protein NDU88_008952 [Pleurodeles waltl]|uniref:Uncharacterized protein n=1 Tax=Pleurodeles waltl TaxID=8319 RepID=A0AAV7QUC1_PLEWA|nr:hypothetical protein NDU88_008952 [Pleurodeles waltl]